MGKHIHRLPASQLAAFLLVGLLSSCGFAYKPVIAHTSKNRMVYTIPLESHALDISMGVDKRNKDDVEFGVQLRITGSAAGHTIKLDTVRLFLTGARHNNQPYEFKQVVSRREGILDYQFIHLTRKDVRHRMHLQIEADITEDGKTTTIKRSLDFKRFFWIDIAGN